MDWLRIEPKTLQLYVRKGGREEEIVFTKEAI